MCACSGYMVTICFQPASFLPKAGMFLPVVGLRLVGGSMSIDRRCSANLSLELSILGQMPAASINVSRFLVSVSRYLVSRSRSIFKTGSTNIRVVRSIASNSTVGNLAPCTLCIWHRLDLRLGCSSVQAPHPVRGEVEGSFCLRQLSLPHTFVIGEQAYSCVCKTG